LPKPKKTQTKKNQLGVWTGKVPDVALLRYVENSLKSSSKKHRGKRSSRNSVQYPRPLGSLSKKNHTTDGRGTTSKVTLGGENCSAEKARGKSSEGQKPKEWKGTKAVKKRSRIPRKKKMGGGGIMCICKRTLVAQPRKGENSPKGKVLLI